MAGRPRAKLVTGNFDLTDDRRYNLIGIGVTQLVHERIAFGWFGRFSRH